MLDVSAIHATIDRSAHTVLVVDDNPVTRYSTVRIVRAAGFQALEADSGTQALQLASSGVSAVVLDVHLPDIDGFAVCRTLRSQRETAQLPVMHLSAAHVHTEDRVTGLNAGADAYLTHPVEPAVLVGTLQALIRARTAEDSLRRSDRRFRAIYSQALNGIGLIEADGRFSDINPAMARLLGRPHEEVMGRPLSDFAPPGWVDFVKEHTLDGRHPGTWRGEFPLMRPTGQWVYLEWSISAHVEPGLRMALAADISERVELDSRRQDILEREQAARATAERLSRTKDDFIAVLSHELRTPLNAIAGWVHILKRRGGTPELLKGLDSIHRNVKAQARIISDILDVSRINSGKLHLEREWAQPVEVVRSAIDALQASIAEKHLDVTVRADAAGGPAWLDPTRFQQIFWNLLTNAIKFSNDSGRIEVDVSRTGAALTLSVRDHGRGISGEFLEHLFDRFTQSDSPDNRRHGGLGLGLSIVKHLAELHGGSVEAYSAGPGEGTTITATLMVAYDGGSQPSLPARSMDDASELPITDRPLRGLDILTVEDHPDASEMLAVVLSDGGARPRQAGDFDAAVQALQQQWPDVVVSDIGLPGRDGYDLARALREMPVPAGRKPPVAIALTAFSRPQDADKALEAGFDAHLGKPLQPHALMATITRLMGSH
ncbi:hybrid sensor histidine kinase/response regulator [Paracidovorax konjaci]|uniref:histidine kinase n=1 Tax=Paracidovorax konjaci TaxID=32040 RepID=A0A1I1TF42_9BURK|nr:response regulator [Paracidovorax konjaci]SFD54973.1 PAS domain S-box-containing protein [Paracidovorax konjaci]